MLACILVCCLLQIGAADEIRPSQPTHYMYTPKASVNEPFNLVLGLHEISFAFPYRLQLQASLLDNIGRINFGFKYGILDNLSVALGLAHTLVHIGTHDHGIPSDAMPRLGAFLCWGFIESGHVEAAMSPHTQIGDLISA
jgi:hypothetical protein